MRNILVFLALMAFVITVPLAMAKEVETVKCCVKTEGKVLSRSKHRCVEMSKSDCKKVGKVVSECEDCK